MNAELEALGRRAVGCKHWRWLPGMLAQSESQGLARVYAVQSDGWIRLCGGHPFESPFYTKTLPYPDLSDPATVGCIADLARKAHGDAGMFCVRIVDLGEIQEWRPRFGNGRDLPLTASGSCGGTTEGGAWVAALEAAP